MTHHTDLGKWTSERRPEDDAKCERIGCEDRTHPVWHKVPDIDKLGRAIHAAKVVGGPWGAACTHRVQDEDDPKFLGIVGEFLPVDYDEDDCGMFDCECRAMAAHLFELMG